LNDLMILFSGPYFKKRRDPDYFSNMGEYSADMLKTLERLESTGSFWKLKWFEKAGVSVAQKLGLM